MMSVRQQKYTPERVRSDCEKNVTVQTARLYHKRKRASGGAAGGTIDTTVKNAHNKKKKKIN